MEKEEYKHIKKDERLDWILPGNSMGDPESCQGHVILVEGTWSDLGQLERKCPNFSHTLLLTDLRVIDKETEEEVLERLVAAINSGKEPASLLYPSDLLQSKEHHHMLDVSRIQSKTESYGFDEYASIHWMYKDGKLVATGNVQAAIEVVDIEVHSTLAKRSLIASLSSLKQTEENLPVGPIHVDAPMVEEPGKEGELKTWSKFIQYEEEIQSLVQIPGLKNMCIGLDAYLRFEKYIEAEIAHFETLLVVAENPVQEELLRDMLLQKERDSYHSIIFVPRRAQMRTTLQRVFRSQKKRVHYVFDEMETFRYIYE